MSKQKRSLEEDIMYYKRKIQKLQEKIPGSSGTTVTIAGEYRERATTARSEVPDKKDSRQVSPAIDSRPSGDISPAPETRTPRDIPAAEPTPRDISIPPRNISSAEWRPPRDISPVREERKAHAILRTRRSDSNVLSEIDPRQLRDIPATGSRKPRPISPATQERDPSPVTLRTANSPPTVIRGADEPARRRDSNVLSEIDDRKLRDIPATGSRKSRDISPTTPERVSPVALRTPNSPPTVIRGADEPRILPQPNINSMEDNVVDSDVSINAPVRQRATGIKTRKSSQIGLTENDNKIDRKEALLNALGDDLSLTGENILAGLAQKWTTILRKGLPIITKDKLLKEYAVPDNCRLLKAPTLNDEIYTIAEFNSRNRDKILEGKQNQLGLGISAIGKAITMLLNQGEEYEVNAMRHLNHGCWLLLDLHHTDTRSRRHLFKSELCRNEVFRNLKIQDLDRDDTLFGNKLGKMVKKQGIPPTPAHQRPSSSSHGDLPLSPRHVRNDPPRYRRS